MHIQKLVGKLGRSNKELEDFAYMVSHDLKGPLKGIVNYSNALVQDYSEQLGAEGRAHLETLQRLSKRMEDLIETLLYYSRISRLEFTPKKTDLARLLDDVLDSLHLTVKESGANISVPRLLPVVECDSVRVGEVFTHLIENAIKYNDKQEKNVEIGYREAKGAGRAARDINDNNTPTFYIRDNGVGISAEDQEKVFTLYKRLHPIGEFGEGTGAGLTIVRKIIEKHGGEIRLESQPGEGTTIFFTLG